MILRHYHSNRNDQCGRIASLSISGLAGMLLICWCVSIGVPDLVMAQAPAGGERSPSFNPPAAGSALRESGSQLSAEERIRRIETILNSVKETGERSEERSYHNKMASVELVALTRLIVVLLVVIAAGFPLIIWILSRRRILGLSGLSSEMAATLLVVEERQAKLATILREMQGEIDYLHTMSTPDLKNLIQQAEAYLKQNQKDLEKAHSQSGTPK
jgi:hypothetical protein